jgi:hypothetical protein
MVNANLPNAQLPWRWIARVEPEEMAPRHRHGHTDRQCQQVELHFNPSWHSGSRPVLQQLPATKLIKCHVVITII